MNQENDMVYEEDNVQINDSDESRDMEEYEYYEDEEDVWECPNGEDVCYDMMCHDHVQELQQIVARWRSHYEGNNSAKRFGKDMQTAHTATAGLLSIHKMPEATYMQWEECDHSLEQGAVIKLLMIRY
jgi:hypothetical protein